MFVEKPLVCEFYDLKQGRTQLICPKISCNLNTGTQFDMVFHFLSEVSHFYEFPVREDTQSFFSVVEPLRSGQPPQTLGVRICLSPSFPLRNFFFLLIGSVSLLPPLPPLSLTTTKINNLMCVVPVTVLLFNKHPTRVFVYLDSLFLLDLSARI